MNVSAKSLALIVGVLLLWAAVTGRLGRLMDGLTTPAPARNTAGAAAAVPPGGVQA